MQIYGEPAVEVGGENWIGQGLLCKFWKSSGIIMENVKTESNQIYIKDPSTMEANHNEQKLWKWVQKWICVFFNWKRSRDH